MRYALYFCLALSLLLVSCKDAPSDKEEQPQLILPSSSGSVNHLAIVIDDSLWKGDVGEVLREELTAPVPGLPQEEPLFSLSHLPTKTFSGFTKRSRIFVQVKPSKHPEFKIAQDTFAAPQTGVFISAPTTKQVKALIKKNAKKMIRALKAREILATQNRIENSLLKTDILKKEFGITMNIPTAYRYAVQKDGFVWIRRDIPHGSMEILVYELPLSAISTQDTAVVKDIIKERDSIGKKYIPGPREGTYMITEKAYMPFLFHTKVDGHPAYLTMGNWTVKDAFMAGPFVNYVIRDKANNRYLAVDGFVFKPQAPTKRDNMFELKAIFESIQFLNEN